MSTLPSLRTLTWILRDLNNHFDGPGDVALAFEDFDGLGTVWRVVMRNDEERQFGHEELPGDGQRFDATAAARRLLAAVRDNCQTTSSPCRILAEGVRS